MHPDKSPSNRQRLQLRGTETLSPRVKQHHPLHFLELGTWITKKVNRFRVHLHYINTIITSIYFQLYVLYFTCLLFSRMHLSVCWSVTLLLFFINFNSLNPFKSFKSILSHSKSSCKTRTRLIGVGLVS